MILAKAVLLGGGINSFLHLIRIWKERQGRKYKQLLILSFVLKGKESNGLMGEVDQNVFFKHGRSN